MTIPHAVGKWRKASKSGPDTSCVELAYVGAVRDSKNRTGPVIPVDVRSLVAAVKTGRLDI